MKTKIVLKIVTLFLLVFFLKPSTVSAQAVCSGYVVKNNSTSCFARVKISRLCGGSLCGPINTALIAPSSQIVLNPCCNGACTYVINLNGWGSLPPLATGVVNISVGPTPGTASQTGGCPTATSTVSMSYSSTTTVIF